MIKLKQEDPRYIIDTTRKVFVYKNLHKDCWSVKQDGLVKAHTTDIELWDCAFQVNAKGREKVLTEKRKNVHAGVKGYIDCLGQAAYGSVGVAVTYNPYKYDSFVNKQTEEPIYHSNFTKLGPKQVFASFAL